MWTVEGLDVPSVSTFLFSWRCRIWPKERKQQMRLKAPVEGSSMLNFDVGLMGVPFEADTRPSKYPSDEPENILQDAF
ncbi:unnamed protein product [Prunus armeniaca]